MHLRSVAKPGDLFCHNLKDMMHLYFEIPGDEL
jgi:hypothetical protein